MRETEVQITFRPSGRTVHVLAGTRLQEAAADVDLVLDSPCGGEGVCGKCRVIVSGETPEPTPVEIALFSAEEIEAGWRLACQSPVCGPVTVEIPKTSLLESHHKILAQSEGSSRPAGEPAVSKRYVELSVPARGDDEPDLIRLRQAVGHFETDLDLLRTISRRMREAGFRGTAVLADGRLLDFEPEDTSAENYAVAVDVGTTTLVAELLHVGSADQTAVTSRLNPQTRFGDDVLSRILHVREHPDGLEELHDTIVNALNEMIGELTRQAGIGRKRIYQLTFSGNTTMQQLLCGIDPSSLGEVPFVPTTGAGLLLRAAELGLHVHPRAVACILPVIGGFVGGDTVAGILATDLTGQKGPTLLVDVGTNGEIVLFADGKLSAASTAAGPAFEGARISQGMRCSTGAIEKVVVDGQLRVNVIGNAPPVGLCGSALIDLAAELLRHGLLTSEGRLLTPEQLPEGVLPDLAERLIDDGGQFPKGQPGFLLTPATETGHGKPIVVTQCDFRELQLATGAIRAGITILLRRADLRASDLKSVLIAGGFGNFIRRSNAQRIGLMPCHVQRRRIRYQGNTALAGARLVTLSTEARDMAEQLARRTEHVDLSCDVDFQMAFADAMIFPREDDIQ